MHETRHFVIVGAGIAGLAAAIVLARTGQRVTVLEQAAEIEEIGAGIQIGPNAFRALQSLGVWQVLAPHTTTPDRIMICNGVSGRTLNTIELGAPFERRFGAPYRVSHRADLLAALLQTAHSLPSVSIRTGCQVEDYALPDAGPSVRLTNSEVIDGDVVVGADGIRSCIRRCLLSDSVLDFAGHTIYRALLPIEAVPQSTNRRSVILWLYPGGHVVHYPVSNGEKFNIVAAADSEWHEDGWHVSATPGEVQRVFGNAASALAQTLAAPNGWHRWAALDRTPVHQWGTGPVTLIGDAAHASLPYLAQGAAMALEDAAVLGQYCNKAEDIEAALRRYEAARQPRTARVVLQSRRMGRIYHMVSGTALRDLVISRLPASLNLSNFAWLYGWGPDQD